MKKSLLTLSALMIAGGAFSQIHFSDDFNDNNLTGWTNVDNDTDASTSNPDYNFWYTGDFSGNFPANGAGSAVSRSWAANVVYNPDNFLISPAIDLTAASGTGLNLLFKTGSIEASPYFDEHYAVYVTTSNVPATIIMSTPVFEETLPGNQMYGHTVDLSAFAGQTVYLTFRHFNTVDENTLILDDVVVKNLQPNDASVQGITLNRYSMPNTNNTLAVSVKNEGSNALTSLTINWNDGTAHSATMSCNIAAGATATVNHSVPVNYATVLEENISVSIDQVNGAADPVTANNTGSAMINTISQLAEKRVVIEEGTGTWCGWCPRGAVAMEAMVTNHPNDFIGIAVHNGDPMTVTAYDAGANLSGYPGCNVDRAMLDQGVSEAAFESYYDDRIDLIVPASISAVSSGTGSALTVDVSATFHTVFAAANYKLAVVLTEDDVTGTASGYNQTNYYSGGAQGAMGGYESLADPVPAAQMVYDHVGRALLGGYTGQAGSVPGAIADGQTAAYSFTYTIPATMDRAQMHAVALLLDAATGEIVNAQQISIAELGINEAASINMNIYPNPATTTATVSFEGKGGEYTVNIIDIAGRVYATQTVSNASGAQTVSLNTSEMKAGSYLISVSNETGSFTQNLVIR